MKISSSILIKFKTVKKFLTQKNMKKPFLACISAGTQYLKKNLDFSDFFQYFSKNHGFLKFESMKNRTKN